MPPCFPFTEIDPDLGPLITEIKTHDFIKFCYFPFV
jgi:hypothetical protein